MSNNSNLASTGALLVENEISKFGGFFSVLSEKFASNPVVSVLRLSGVIGKRGMKGGLTLEAMNKNIEKAFKPSKLKAVCLVINSPGGSPVQSEFIADRIIALSKEKKVPVYSFVEDVGASGGYWLACAGEEIYVSKSSIVGSIGVISAGFGFQDAISKLGIERRIYSQGNNKSVLDPFSKEKKEDVKIISKIQKDIHEHFINYVKSRRKSRLTQSDDILFNGEFWSGQTATEFGLVDGINDLYSFIKERFGDKVKIEYITEKQSWVKQKFGIGYDEKAIADAIVDKIKDEILIYQKFDLY